MRLQQQKLFVHAGRRHFVDHRPVQLLDRVKRSAGPRALGYPRGMLEDKADGGDESLPIGAIELSESDHLHRKAVRLTFLHRAPSSGAGPRCEASCGPRDARSVTSLGPLRLLARSGVICRPPPHGAPAGTSTEPPSVTSDRNFAVIPPRSKSSCIDVATCEAWFRGRTAILSCENSRPGQ